MEKTHNVATLVKNSTCWMSTMHSALLWFAVIEEPGLCSTLIQGGTENLMTAHGSLV